MRPGLSPGVLVPILVCGLAACGGSGGSTTAPGPAPTVAPTPLPPIVVAERTGYALRAGYIAWLPFPTSRAGTLDTTVDWTLAANDVNVYLVAGECNYDQLAAGQCRVVASALGKAKPERFSYSSAQASTYTIFIDNEGPGDESVSFQVVLSATLSAGSRHPDGAASSPDGVVRQAPR